MIQFNSKSVEASIIARGRGSATHGSSSLRARVDLARYYWLVEASRPALTTAEASLICDACNGWAPWNHPNSPDLLWLQVQEGIDQDDLDEKWGVGYEFIARLREMTLAERFALTDAVERFWAAAGEQPVDAFFKLNNHVTKRQPAQKEGMK